MPKRVDHEAYRQQIITKAAELFEAQGYEGVGMRDVANHVGISKSALYHYFPGKEALFEGVVRATVQQDITGLPPAMAAVPFAERLEAFLGYMLANEDWYARQYAILMEYVRVRDADERAEPMVEATEQYVQGMADFLGITPDEARAFYHHLTGVLLQRIFDGRQTDLRQAAQWFVDYFVEKYER